MATHHEQTEHGSDDAPVVAYEAPAIESTVEVTALMTWGGSKGGGKDKGGGGHHS